jgi:chromosome condensin MukBEF complex kleisin-like MukF subunit
MGNIFLKTLIMFLLSFAIAMVVALLIYWIRRLLTSVRVNSFFDEKSKKMVKRAQRIHKIHDKKLVIISEEVEHEVHPELFDFYNGINEEFEPSEDFHGTLKPIVRRKRNTKKHKNI